MNLLLIGGLPLHEFNDVPFWKLLGLYWLMVLTSVHEVSVGLFWMVYGKRAVPAPSGL